MSDFSINVESILDADTSDNLLLVAQWIKDSMQRAGQSIDDYYFKITFSIGDLQLECVNESEFLKHSFGQYIRLHLLVMGFNIAKPNEVFFHISKKFTLLNEGKNVSVSCNDILILKRIITTMKQEKERFEAIKGNQSPTILINGSNNQIGVANTGDNNQFDTVTAGNNNTINSQVQPSKKAQLGFWQGVLQFIVSNILWAIIVAIILVALTVIGITQPDWLRF